MWYDRDIDAVMERTQKRDKTFTRIRDVATVHRRRGRKRRQEAVRTLPRPEAVGLACRTAAPNASSTVDSTSSGPLTVAGVGE